VNRSLPPVQVILEAMKGLLDMRRSGKVKRILFLKTWGKLRAYLTLTHEYQQWRWLVKQRAGGACEECGEIGAHAHHIVPISRDVDRALDLKNGRYLCFRCHSGQPGHKLRPRSNGRPTHRNPAELRNPRGPTRPRSEARPTGSRAKRGPNSIANKRAS
jgi:5-methylcytosine-specific restriction endonuclease McrA